MALFLSKYINKIDNKGRLSIPSSFRAHLYSDEFSGVVLFCSPKYACLEGFDWKSMEAMAGRLDQFDMFSAEQDDMAASIFGAAKPLSLDGQGRVVVPDDLMAYAGLDAQAAIVGMGRKFQIWNPETFHARQEEARKNVEAQGLTLPGDAKTRKAEGGRE